MLKKSLFIIIILFFLVFNVKSSEAAITSYNFTTESNIWGELCTDDRNDGPPPNQKVPTCLDSVTDVTSNNNLDSDDNSRVLSQGEHSWIKFNVSVQQTISDISLINWTWNGRTYDIGAGVKAYLYLYNFTSSSYESFNSTSSTSDVNMIMSGEVIEDLVSSTTNEAILLIKHDVAFSNFYGINTDFVKLEITYEAAPSIDTPIIEVNTTETYAYTTDDLNCSVTVTDPTNATPTAEFTWYNDSYDKMFNETILCQSGVLCGSSWLGKDNYSHHINVTCSVRGWDGESWSQPKNSTAFFINNSIPSVDSVNVNKTSNIQESDDLNCTVLGQSDDDKEDSLTTHYDWYKDGVAQDIDNLKLDNTLTSANEEWYCLAWVHDGFINSTNFTSSTVSIGTALEPPVIVSTNSTSGISGINSTSDFPTNNNTFINFTAFITDANSATEGWNISICKTTGFSNGVCDGGEWCYYEGNTSGIVNLTCSYTLSGETNQEYNYHVYVTDCEGLTSASKSNTFEVNHHPDISTNLKPLNNTYISLNWSLINWTTSDLDGDSVNSTFYASSDRDNVSNYIQLEFNGTGNQKNITELLDGIRYYWKILTIDEHYYNSTNPTDIYEFIVDYSPPDVTRQTLSKSQVVSGSEVVIYSNVTDNNATISRVSVNVNDSSGATTSYDMSLSQGTNAPGNNLLYSKTLTPSLLGAWKVLDYTVTDEVGNSQTVNSTLTFNVEESTGGGAGGTVGGTQQITGEDIRKEVQAILYTKGDGLCESDKGEDSFNSRDCIVNLDTTIFCFPPLKYVPILNTMFKESINCNWKQTRFVQFSVVGLFLIFLFAETKRKGKVRGR